MLTDQLPPQLQWLTWATVTLRFLAAFVSASWAAALAFRRIRRWRRQRREGH